jgi:SHS2 domain-containing protein
MHEWREHTGELELHLTAGTPDELFGEASLAIADVLGEGAGGEAVQRRVDVTAPDPAALLAEWLGELVWLAEREGLIPERVTELTVGDGAAHGTLAMRRGRSRDLVKAVTYHGLECARHDDGWRASVVFDV